MLMSAASRMPAILFISAIRSVSSSPTSVKSIFHCPVRVSASVTGVLKSYFSVPLYQPSKR